MSTIPPSSRSRTSDNAAKAQFDLPSQPLAAGSGDPEPTEVGAQTTRRALAVDEPAMDEAAKQEFLWHIHQYLGEYARFGDTKAAFAGAIASALLGALYGAKAYVPLVKTPYSQWLPVTWLAATSGLFLLASIVLAIATVLPRLRGTVSKGFIYWGNIAAYGEVEQLRTSFHAQSARTLNDHLLHHIFDISFRVCIPKYRSVTLCIWTLVVGGFLAAAAALLLQGMP